MSVRAAPIDVLRPRRFGDTVTAVLLKVCDAIFAFQRVWPLIWFRGFVIVARNDDVREVLSRSADFPVTYVDKLNVVMDGEPFFLGMDGEAHSGDVAAMRLVVKDDDVPNLARLATQRCAALVEAAGGTIEVVDFVRQVTLEVFCNYLGVTEPPGQDLRVIANRLFEFVLFDLRNDKSLGAEVRPMAKALRDHVDKLIAERKAAPPKDDVLGRCLAQQGEHREGFSDLQIRTALIGLIFGGLPQPQMAAPQILEQLFRRPAQLAAAQSLARANDDPALASYVFEALRFDPVAPVLVRRARHDRRIAEGTRRAKTIRAGALVLAALRSAMKDPRRVRDPGSFDPTRPWRTYMLFGGGPHSCFAENINRTLIPVMLKELLRRDQLRRAPGKPGKLVMRGFFADRLWVTFAAD